MDFDSAIKNINNLLIEKQPQTFNRSWIRINAPGAYRFIQKNIRAENGGIDWDRITRELNPRFQKQWTGSLRKQAKPYRDNSEANFVSRLSRKWTFRPFELSSTLVQPSVA